VVFDLLLLVPYLLQTVSFASVHNWAVHGPILISWGIVTLLLAMLIQLLTLRCRAKPFVWLMGAYSALVVVALALWYGAGAAATMPEYQWIALLVSLLMLTASYFLWRATSHPPADFIEAITEQPR
jgi:hypothetical protein